MSVTKPPVGPNDMPGIDWNAVYVEILRGAQREGPVADYDYEDAKDTVHALTERFLARDYVARKITGVEQWFETPLARGIADVVAAEDQWAADWKVRVTGELDPAWQTRQTESWQWRITAAALGLKTFVYRGVTRQTGKVREVEIAVPEDNGERVERFLRQLIDQREVLIGAESFTDYFSPGPWPQNRPSSCREYNRMCEFDAECSTGTEPRVSIFESEDATRRAHRAFSYSGAMTFMKCQEKFRRRLFVPKDGHDESANEATEFGNMVHSGVAEVYRQAYRLPASLTPEQGEKA